MEKSNHSYETYSRRSIYNLSDNELVYLRKQIILNSKDNLDYTNTYHVHPNQARAFFDGYFGYIVSKTKDYKGWNKENLFALIEIEDTFANLIEYRDMMVARKELLAQCQEI